MTRSEYRNGGVTPAAGAKADLMSCDGADGGLSMYQVLGIAAVVCVLVPLIYVLLAEEQVTENQTHHSHHHDHQPLIP